MTPRAKLCEVQVDVARRGSFAEPQARWELLHGMLALVTEMADSPAFSYHREHLRIAALAFDEAERSEWHQVQKLHEERRGGRA